MPVKKTSENAKIGAGKPGPGRPKGVPNKATAAVKDMILQALNEEGGVRYLRTLARSEPKAFATLVGKLVPLDVNAKLDGEIGMKPIVLGSPPAE